jgi:soluble lytic murein transglycosylase-like protein
MRSALLTALVLMLPLAAGADSIRSWTDRDGVVHYTNVHGSAKKPAKYVQTGDGAVKVVLEGQDAPPATAQGAGWQPRDVAHFDEHIEDACRRYNIPVALAKAIMAAESNFNRQAMSRVGAVGLMQLMPTTAVDMYVDDLWDPRENIHGGVRYLRVLTNEFEGDLVKVIAAYNAGPDAVKKAGGVPNIPETREYVQRVLRLYKQYKNG